MMQDLSILGLSSTQFPDCLWVLSPSPVSSCQPSLLLSWCHLLKVLSHSFQCDASSRLWAGKPRSLWIECESRVNDDVLSFPAGLWHNYFKASEVALLLRSRASNTASNSTLTPTGCATLNTAHLISQGLGFPICKMGEIIVPTP